MVETDAARNGYCFACRPHRTGHEPGLPRSRIFVRRLPCQLRSLEQEFVGLVRNPIVDEVALRPIERIRLDDVRTRLKVFPVNVQNDIGSRPNQALIPPLERSSPTITRRQVPLL